MTFLSLRSTLPTVTSSGKGGRVDDESINENRLCLELPRQSAPRPAQLRPCRFCHNSSPERPRRNAWPTGQDLGEHMKQSKLIVTILEPEPGDLGFDPLSDEQRSRLTIDRKDNDGKHTPLIEAVEAFPGAGFELMHYPPILVGSSLVALPPFVTTNTRFRGAEKQ